MNRLLRVVSLAVLSCSPLAAQESGSGERPRWGFGVTLNPTTVLFEDGLGFLPIGLTNFLIPIRTGERTYVEPEFGIFRFKAETDVGTGTAESTVTNLRLGVGILMELTERSALRPYVGPRVGFIRTTFETSGVFGGDESTQTGFFVAGVLGAQHYFSRHFTIGGEVQLNWMSMNAEDAGGGGEADQSLLTTQALATIRWFF